MSDLLAALQAQLGELHSAPRYRHLETPSGIDFCTNDYLGLARDLALTLARRVLART